MRSLATAFNLLAFANAYTTFETICSKPSDVVNYVSSADNRSTLDILWSCLLTIVACTWSVQHLNVPEQREGRDPGWMGDIKWALKRSWTSTKWMMITIIAPEYLFTKNWADLSLAKINTPKLQKLAVEDGVPWTLSHTLLADMGGFVIRSYVPDRIKKSTNTSTSPNAARSRYSNPFHLIAADILRLREDKVLDRLPYISEDELNDKSKGDSFVRVIAIAQISWMAVQIAARGVKHLAISQLEIGVLAFAACAILIYIINWKKPKAVCTPFTVLQFESEIPGNVITSIGKKAKDNDFWLGFSEQYQRGSPIKNDYYYAIEGEDESIEDIIAAIVVTMAFGGIHLAAWNFAFPTFIEQIMWRCSGLICATFFIVYTFIVSARVVMEELLGIEVKSRSKDFDAGVFVLAFVLYVVARLFLFVEIFRLLCFLPPSAYIATWALNIPHIA
ncbi:hypothetical protein EG329_013630 [Mollisiaceae sp. DMI_Dod_QoI]|nr:hypothetical protein EG329_013630 [Helotiales sp. DMI_Dod_QoI]